MSASLKISADTSEVKKSILDLSRSLKTIGTSKVTIFSNDDKKFLRTELKNELALMKKRLGDNRAEIKRMVDQQKELTKGSKEELEVRKKILDAYKTQSRLARESEEVNKTSKSMGGGFGGGGGIAGLASLAGVAALAVGAMAIAKGIQATNQYVGGTPNRVRLKGLGVNEDSFGSADTLARAGVTEQELIQRRIEATSILGRQGSTNAGELQKAGFERAYGLQGGTMTSTAAGLRSSFGGSGANDAQTKLQASIMASGLEDALGPYLQTMTSLLSSINENGTMNTGDLTNLMARLTKDGGRTPDQMSKAFETINSSVMGASGESSAFLQNAFARSGIGGGTIGGTKFAMSSGGIFGMNQDELAKRGYNPELLKNMGSAGMFTGIGGRANAIMNQFKQSGGLGANQSISGITDVNQQVGLGNMANSVFGTKGNQGFDALMMLEKVQNKQMSSKDFDAQLRKMQEGKDPQVDRLEKINSSLAGQTEILTNIDTNLSEALGKQGVTARNAMKSVENQGTISATGLAQGINDTGIVGGLGGAAEGTAKYFNKGGLGSDIYDAVVGGDEDEDIGRMTSPEAIERQRQKMKSSWGRGGDASTSSMGFPTAKAIGQEVANALKQTGNKAIKPSVTIKNQHSDGKVSERTYK